MGVKNTNKTAYAMCFGVVWCGVVSIQHSYIDRARGGHLHNETSITNIGCLRRAPSDTCLRWCWGDITDHGGQVYVTVNVTASIVVWRYWEQAWRRYASSGCLVFVHNSGFPLPHSTPNKAGWSLVVSFCLWMWYGSNISEWFPTDSYLEMYPAML